jgi:hypothetical protein
MQDDTRSIFNRASCAPREGVFIPRKQVQKMRRARDLKGMYGTTQLLAEFGLILGDAVLAELNGLPTITLPMTTA